MRVMTTGVHHPRDLGGVGGITLLLDRKGIHVRSQADGLPWPSTLYEPHHTRFSHTGSESYTQSLQSTAYEIGGCLFLKTQFGIAMNLPSDIDQILSDIFCFPVEDLSQI